MLSVLTRSSTIKIKSNAGLRAALLQAFTGTDTDHRSNVGGAAMGACGEWSSGRTPFNLWPYFLGNSLGAGQRFCCSGSGRKFGRANFGLYFLRDLRTVSVILLTNRKCPSSKQCLPASNVGLGGPELVFLFGERGFGLHGGHLIAHDS